MGIADDVAIVGVGDQKTPDGGHHPSTGSGRTQVGLISRHEGLTMHLDALYCSDGCLCWITVKITGRAAKRNNAKRSPIFREVVK